MTTPTSKKPSRHLRISDLRGIAQLATQATEGVTSVVEGVHQSVWTTVGVPEGKTPGRTRGITGLIYKGVHGVTQLAGRSVDAVLGGLQALAESEDDTGIGTPQREAVLAALNGVMGDRLVESNNPFAIPMTLRFAGETLNWQSPPSMPEATGKVLLLIHGLCMNDLQWRTQHEGRVTDHGDALASLLGYSPVHLRYNSGLHASTNGRELSALLEELVVHWPTPIEELTVVAHSMGGLLIRSAVHYAEEEALCWPGHLRSIVFLGTPHHGAPLEQAGNWVNSALGRIPYTAPFVRLGRLRSAGITDLRYGHVLDDDWIGRDRFQRDPDTRRMMPLPEGVACYAVAATLAAERGILANHLVGDGLVPLNSALGQHGDAERTLMFEKHSQWIGYRMNHMDLLSSPEVTRQMVRWLTPRRNAAEPGSP